MTFEEWASKRFGTEISDGDFYSLPGYRAAFEAGQKSVQRKPLTIDECMKRWDIVKQSGHVDRATFIAGVRFAEKHHKIGGGDE